MKKAIFSLGLGSLILSGFAAYAGAEFPLEITKRVCVTYVHSNATEALQDVTMNAIAETKASCEEHPGGTGAISTLKSIEVKNVGRCGFGLDVFEYTLKGTCHIP